MTEGYFRLFGAPVILGRTFTELEDSPNGGRVVVLSYGLWQRKFAGDPAVIGKSLSMGNEPDTIVGVIGKEFLSDPQADLWLPFQFDPVSTDPNHYFQVTSTHDYRGHAATFSLARWRCLPAHPGDQRGEHPGTK